MKTFCVAYFDGHAGKLTQTIVQAETENAAILDFLTVKGYDMFSFKESGGGFNDFCEYADIWIYALDLTNVEIL